VGVFWALAWNRWYHDRYTEQPGITAEESAEIGKSVGPNSDEHASIPWRKLLKNRQVWLICAMYWCYSWGPWFYFSWFPTYLVRGAGFSIAEMGFFSSFPFLLGVVGNLIGGTLSDRLVKRYGLKTGRRALACMSLFLSSLLILGMGISRDRSAIVILSSLGFGVVDLMLPSAWAICLDVGQRYSGVVSGIMNTFGQLSGFVCTIVFGYIVKATGSYSAPVWVISGMVLVSAALFAAIDPTHALAEEEKLDSAP
jgi:nitrate/nitrite transporter NarK